MLSTTLATLLALSLASTPLPGPIFVEVDCNAGHSLARALQRPELTPGSTVAVSGTCAGRFVVITDGLRLQGDPAGGTVLTAPDSDPLATILEVRGATGVSVRWFEIRDGGRGVYFHRSPDGLLGFSELESLEVAATFEESQASRVLECEFDGNQIALNAWQRSTVNIQRSSFLDSGSIGLAVSDYSKLVMSDSTVVGSGQSGLELRDYSSARLLDSDFHSNGDLHLFAQGDSSILVGPGSNIGGAFDSTVYSVILDSDSSLQAAVPSVFAGDLVATRGSTIELSRSTVDGAITAETFSKVVLFGTQFGLPANCRTGGDLVCFGNAAVTSNGCASAVDSCLVPGSIGNEPAPPPTRIPTDETRSEFRSHEGAR